MKTFLIFDAATRIGSYTTNAVSAVDVTALGPFVKEVDPALTVNPHEWRLDEATDTVVAYNAPLDLARLKLEAKKRIDAKALRLQSRVITSGPGQELIYEQKAKELARYQNDPAPDPVDYPWCAAERGITGDTLDDVMAVITSKMAEWTQLGATLNALRLGGKRDIDAAASESEIEAIENAIVWPVVDP